MPSRRLLLPLLTLFAIGCGGEADQGIKTYRVQKPGDAPGNAGLPPNHPPMAGGPPAPPQAGPAEQGTGPYRILGAMFPADNPQWFLKLSGPASEVAKVEAEVDAFLATVKFPKGPGEQPTWDLPPTWKTGTPRKSMFPPFATLLVGEKQLEMNATQAGGGLGMNLDRWAGQVGAEGDNRKTRELTTASGVNGLRVDLTGPRNPGGGMMMPPR